MSTETTSGLRIVSNVPLPTNQRASNGSRDKRLKELKITEMRPGDFADCSNDELAKVGINSAWERARLKLWVYAYGKENGKKYTCRKTADGYGIWRLL